MKSLTVILSSVILLATLNACKASSVTCSGPGCSNPAVPQYVYVYPNGQQAQQPVQQQPVAPVQQQPAQPQIIYINPGNNQPAWYNSPVGGASATGVYQDTAGRTTVTPIEAATATGVVQQIGRDVVLSMNGPDIATFGKAARMTDSTPILHLYFGENYEVQGTWTSDRTIRFANALKINNQGGNIKFIINRDGTVYANNWLNLHDGRVTGAGGAFVAIDKTTPATEGTVLYIQFGGI